MKLNNQKRWGKMWLATVGFVIYSVNTTFSHSIGINGMEFKKSGQIVWEGEPVNKTESQQENTYSYLSSIHGKVLSSIQGSSWGSVDGYYGVVLEPGIVFVFSGDSNAKSSGTYLNVTYQYRSDPKATSSVGVKYSENNGLYKYSSTMPSGQAYLDRPSYYTQVYQAANLRGALYISESVKPKKYAYSGNIWLEVGLMRITLTEGISFTFAPSIQCTINTPPKIDFGKVNIWDWKGNTSGTPGGNRKDVLGVVDGNFMINCTGDNGAHTPAKLTLKGTIQTYTNDLKMTMDATGDLAPATVRASIKSIFAPCNNGGTQFGPGTKTPPGNEVDLGELTVGPHQVPYRFSLCALGQGFKSGAASATATVTIDWE